MPNLFCELRPSLSSILSIFQASGWKEQSEENSSNNKKKKKSFFVCLFVCLLLALFLGANGGCGWRWPGQEQQGFCGLSLLFSCCVFSPVLCM
jgi:hypothetical protein